MLEQMWEGEELSFIDSGIANWSVTQKISKNSQNPKISVPSGPDIPLFGVSPRDSIRYSIPHIIAQP